LFVLIKAMTTAPDVLAAATTVAKFRDYDDKKQPNVDQLPGAFWPR